MDQNLENGYSPTMLLPGAMITAAGWAGESALNPGAPISRVEIEVDDQTIGLAALNVSRPDVANTIGRADYGNSGWTFSGPLTGIQPGSHYLRARAYTHSGASILLPGERPILVQAPGLNGFTSTGQPARYSFALNYTPNGNISAASDTVNGAWSYQYDSLDRLTTGQSASTGVSWTYDSFGNRIRQTALAGSVPESYLTFSTNTNRADQVCYDASGNVLDDVPCNQADLHANTYDAEGKLTSSAYGSTSYVYDADGLRVAKQSFGATTNVYFYDVAGHMTVETDGSGALLRQELYAGDQHVATALGQTGPFIYPHTNWLGTETARSDGNGNLCETLSALSFGDGLQVSGSCDPSHKFYTGKERDTESGLDYFGARYYGSSMGRFMSPDPMNLTDERLMNPSNTLNKYAYAANNPLKYVDPDGKDITYFYDPGGTAGHAVLFAYNQATGDSALESFGPNIHAPLGAGESNFDMNLFSSAQGLRDNYVSLTIQTNPELTQEVITYMRSNPDPSVWAMTGPNCSTQCGKILQKFKLDYQKSLVNRNLTPKFLFKNLMSRYNPGQSTSNPQQGHDYGAPRADMYQLLWNHINPDNFSVTTSQQDSKNGVPIAPCGGDNPCNK